ncbi:Uma2 family endonuclease [Streptomyces caniscabiei]|uniref:Uma2 family endonuclease n=1 Tax=Streptomyces caniscabiei TaxID=2746961 RepID=UPI0030100FC1
MRRALDRFLDDGEYACYQDGNVIHNRGAWIPDAFVAPGDTEPCRDEDDMGVTADSVRLVVEVVSPGKRNQDRDRVKKRREYARAGIPVYVIIDDYDGEGAVTLFTGPRPEAADWSDIRPCPLRHGGRHPGRASQGLRHRRGDHGGEAGLNSGQAR